MSSGERGAPVSALQLELGGMGFGLDDLARVVGRTLSDEQADVVTAPLLAPDQDPPAPLVQLVWDRYDAARAAVGRGSRPRAAAVVPTARGSR